MRSSMDDDDDAFPPPPPGTHERPLAFVKAALPMTNTNDGFFLFMGKKFKLFFCSALFRVLHNIGFSGVLLSLKKNASKFEPRRRKKFSTAKARNHTTYKTPVFAKRKRTPRCRFRVRIYYSRRRLRAEERSTRPPRRRHTKAKPLPSRCALPTMVRPSL